MIANPSNTCPAATPQPFTLNDLRVHSVFEEAPPPMSALTLAGIVLSMVLAVGAFIWLDPLRLLTRTDASPPAPATVASAEPARSTETQEIGSPLTPVPATKSVEAPIAPAVVPAPHVPAAVARPHAASTKPASRANPMDKTTTTALRATPKETAAPPVPPSKPDEQTASPATLTRLQEKTDAPIVLKPADDSRNAPKPAGTSDQTPVTE